MAISMVALGALLLFFSLKVKPDVPPGGLPTATAPATAPTGGTTPVDARKVAVAQHMSGMLLLLCLIAFTVGATCIIWLIIDLRRSRPAWQTQQRYPRRR